MMRVWGTSEAWERGLLGGFPLATNGRHDGTLLLQFGKCLIDFLAVGTQCLGNIACGDGFACLAHGLEYLFFHCG